MTLHIATSHQFGSVAARALHAPVGFVTENLLLGPSAADPDEHAQKRTDFWDLRGRELTRFRTGLRDLGAAIHSSDRVTIWTTPCLAHTAALFWLCAWRLRCWPRQPDLDLVVLGPDPGPVAGLDRINTRVKGDDVRRGQGDVRPLSLARVQRLARGWRKLTGVAPLSAPEAGRVDQEHRDLLDLATYEAGFFPRLGARGPALSRFDELVFSCLGDDALTPVDVFAHDSAAGEELRKWLDHTGDVFLATRLSQWAQHRGAEAALESEPVRPERRMLEARYRLSKVGQAIRRQGLQEIGQGPPVAVFGAVAYDPLAPWVVLDDSAAGPSMRRLGQAGRAV
jgi:hypothetical protein